MSRQILVALLIAIAPMYVLSADNSSQHLEDDLRVMRQELTDKLSPAEAYLLERIEEIERQIGKSPNSWLQPPVILAGLIAIAGWGVALLQFYGNRRQRTWELLLESLRWFEGGTQPRSIGIALVETKWNHHIEFRSRWASILVNQAIYLLTRKKDRDARHERANLYRIMDFLINTVGPAEILADIEHDLLCETLREYDPKSDRGLIGLNSSRLESWKEYFGAT